MSSLPTAQPPETATAHRPGLRRWLAGLLAAVLVLGGSLTATAPAFAEGAPTITVTEAPREGGTVTITGSGFSPAEPGVYLGVAPSSATGGFYQSAGVLLGSETVWVGPSNEDGVSDAGRTAKLQADGSFSVEVTIPAYSDDVPAYVVLTSKAHGQGAADPSQDVRAEITYVAAEEPGTEEPGTEEPGTEEPGTEEPGTEEPGTEEPGTEEPGTEEPGTEEPGTEEPGTEEPGTGKPTVVVSKTTGIDPHGETVTITGSGFVPNGAATTGTRPPLAGKFTGAYIAFGAFADNWAPSTGAAGATRPTGDVKWGVHESDLATIGGANAGGIVIAADGTFETTLTVSYDYAGALADGNYGIYTYPGGGAKNAEFESFTAISFTPTVFVSKTTGLDPFGDTVTVKGVGFTQSTETTGTRPPLAGRFSGAYVAFGAFADDWAPSTGAASATRPTGDVKWGVHEADLATIGGAARGGIVISEDGTFETELNVSAGYAGALADGNYGIYTYPGGGAKYAPFETATPVAFAPKVTVSKTSGLDPAGETVTVRGAGFLPAGAATTGTRPPLAGKFTGAYVVFGSFADGWQPSTGGAAALRKVDAQKWAVQQEDLATIGGANAGGIVIGAGGTFETTLTVREFEGALENGRYGIYTYPGGGAKHAPFETATLIDFADPAPVIDPTITVTPSTNVDSTVANTFTISGTGYVGDGALNGAYVLIGESGVWDGSGPLPSAGWLAQGWVMPQQIQGGAFTTTLTVTAGKLDPAKSYVVASSAAHGLSITDRSLDAFAPISIAPLAPTGPTLTVTPSTNVDGSVANTFTVRGTGYTGAGAAQGVYVLLGEDDIWTGDGPLVAEGWLAQAWVTPMQLSGGAFTTTLTVPAGKLDAAKGYVVASSAAHGLSVTDRSLDAFAPVTVKAGTTPEPPKPPTPPVVNPRPTTPGTVVPGGSLSWGVSERFIAYVAGPIANGSISVSGATRSGGVFQFGQSGGSYKAATGRGTAEYAGSVNFRGHAGVLDLTFADPVLRVTSPQSGVLSVVANGSRVDLASVDLGAAAKSTTNGATRFANAPVALLATGVSAFNGFYGAGQALAPLTAVIGSPAAAPAGDSGTVVTASASSSTQRDIPATPPATTGIVLDTATLEALGAGKVVTVTAGGFQPGEEDVAAVVYSTPIVLADDLSADAAGDVTWTGSIPASLEPGVHTLTFQGSTNVGVQFTVPAEQAGVCKVSAGDLDWGFKESFRSYLTSGIANGDWALAGVTEDGGVFAFTGATGSLNETGRGVVAYPGSVEFTGHDGALDTTISNPKIELDGNGGAIVLLDVAGTTQDGEPIDLKSVRFAELELADGVTLKDGVLAGEATAVLTEDGAAAFGTYPAGEELDPVSFTATVSGDCVVTAAVADSTDAEEAEPTTEGDVAAAADDASQTGPAWWVWALIASLLVILLAVIAVIVIRARRSAEQG